MNAMRVFLHNLMWEDDSSMFLQRTDAFLDIAEKHGIGILFVIFDSCWNSDPNLGAQPEPIPYVHNSQWVQSPGEDIVNNDEEFLKLENYVTGVMTHYKSDYRVIGWDLWNEPDNSGYSPDHIATLLASVFSWARQVSPSQPLTSCLWTGGRWDQHEKLNSLERLCIDESDVISFHNYGDILGMSERAESLMGYGMLLRRHNLLSSYCDEMFLASLDKPVMCTEYMARGKNSTFNPHMGYLKNMHISAFNWGVVSGKTQTIYPWDSSNDPNPYEGIDDPDPWFHDIFRPDGTARYEEEANYIKSVTGV